MAKSKEKSVPEEINGNNNAEMPAEPTVSVEPLVDDDARREGRPPLTWNDGTPVVYDWAADLRDDKGNPHPGKIGQYILAKKSFQTFRDTSATYAYDADTASATYGLYVDGGKPWIGEATQTLVRAATTTSIVNQVIGHIQRSTYTDRKAIDKVNIDLVPVGNGILRLNTGELLEYTPDMAFLAKWPAEFKADADTAPIEEYMRSTFAEEDIDAVQEYIGWILERSMEYQRNLLLIAGGDNGKTVWENIIRAVIGDNNVSSVSLHKLTSTSDRFSAFGLYQKYANIYDDLPRQAIRDAGNFKVMSGGGKAAFEKKFEQMFFAESFAKGIYSTNEFPPVDDTTMAFFKRWIVIKMPYTFVDEKETLGDGERFKDFTIEKTMTTPEMLSAWLKWMMAGLKRLKENNTFTSSKRMEDAKKEWIRQTNSFRLFAKSELTRDATSYILKKPDLIGAYEGFCEYIDAPMIRDVEKSIGMRLMGEFTTATKYRPTQKDNAPRPMGWKGVRFTHELTGQGEGQKTPRRSIHSGVFEE